MKDTKQARTEQTPRGVAIPIEFQVVETVQDVIQAEPGGDMTVGQVIDKIVDSHFRDGREIGKVTLDLGAFSKAFCPSRRRD